MGTRTGRGEVVLVGFDPEKITYGELLKLFWESHDPTQGMRQGNGIGTQYRSGIYTFSDDQLMQAEQSKLEYQKALDEAGHPREITTEIRPAGPFSEDYHEQYLAKNLNGCCGLGGTGVSCPWGTTSAGGAARCGRWLTKLRRTRCSV